MAERISISNFGPIKRAEIPDLKHLNVFVGASGSGKSTILKLISLFQWIFKMACIRSYLKYCGIRKSPFRFNFLSLLKKDGLDCYLRTDTEIEYENGSFRVKYDKQHNKLSFNSTTVAASELSLEKIIYVSDNRVVVPELASNMLSTRPGLPIYLEDTFNNFLTAVEQVGETELPYLGVRMAPQRTPAGRRVMVMPAKGSSGYSMPLYEASSGIQSASPLHYIVDYYTSRYDLTAAMNSSIFKYVSMVDDLAAFSVPKDLDKFAHKRINLMIEEPEISLFPSNQRGLMEWMLSRCMATHKGGVEFNVSFATHSPYIVNHLNLLIKAADKGTDINGAALQYDDLNVFLVRDGMICDLKLRNAHLVNTDVLSDDITAIYEEYHKLDERGN